MPQTVAPPPRTGDAAQGPWFADPSWSAAPDHAAPPSDEPATEPAHPKPAATARTVAAGVLFAALATAVGASLVMLIAALRLLGSDDVRLDLGGLPAVLLAVAFAAATVAALLFLTRQWAAPRVPTVLLAVVVSIAWPLSGIPFPAALIAIVAVGLALGRDRRCAGGVRVSGPNPVVALAVAAALLAIAGAATATTHPAVPTAPESPRAIRRRTRARVPRRRQPRDRARRDARASGGGEPPATTRPTSAGAETPDGAAAEASHRAGPRRRKPRPPRRPRAPARSRTRRRTTTTTSALPETPGATADHAGGDAREPPPSLHPSLPKRHRAGPLPPRPRSPRRRPRPSDDAGAERRAGDADRGRGELRPRVLPRARREALRGRVEVAVARRPDPLRPVRRLEGRLRQDALQQAARHRRHGDRE